MQLIKKVTQRLLQVGRASRILREHGLINTTDLLVATGATVVLAAGVGAAVLGTLDDAKYGKAQPDGQAVSNAIAQFYNDTGKWPGQAEQAAGVTSGAATGTLLLTTLDADFRPTEYQSKLSTAAATCANNSLEGFVGVTIGAATFATADLLNINDYLVRKPDETKYPNWQGPYLTTEMKTDPWDRPWVINLQPLYCSEDTGVGATGGQVTGGNLGYAWLLSGGSNRTITTALTDANLDNTGDDAGANLGKLVKRSTGGTDATN